MQQLAMASAKRAAWSTDSSSRIDGQDHIEVDVDGEVLKLRNHLLSRCLVYPYLPLLLTLNQFKASQGSIAAHVIYRGLSGWTQTSKITVQLRTGTTRHSNVGRQHETISPRGACMYCLYRRGGIRIFSVCVHLVRSSEVEQWRRRARPSSKPVPQTFR